MTTMPIINVSACLNDINDGAARIICAAFTDRGVKGKQDGLRKLRSSKPFKRVETAEQGYANYVWRMLCFDLVGSGKHACMPVCAEFEVWDGYELEFGRKPKYDEPGYDEWKQGVRTVRESLDDLIKRFESNLPPEAMKGIIRWGRALGMI